MVAIPERGELAEIPLPKLLLDLASASFDGLLHLTREPHTKVFRFQRGAPISAESSLASETLGVQLLDQGLLDHDQYRQVSEHVSKRKVKEGAALLELGFIEPKKLFLALKEQVRTRLVDCFGWPRGSFVVEPQDAPSEKAQPFRVDLLTVIQDGIETHWSAENVMLALQPHLNETVARNRRLSRIQERLLWDDSVAALIDGLDGTRTFWRALQNAKTPRALAAAWLIDAIRAVDYSEPLPETEDTEEEPVLEIEPEIEIILTEEVQAEAADAAPTAEADDAGERGMDEVLMLEVSQKYVALADLDYYELLGIEQNAAPADIKNAYRAAAKRYHPDALARAGLDRETQEKAGKVFAAIGKAHSVLVDPNRRRSYDASLESDETDLDAERLAAAETNYRKGEILMRQGNFKGALEFLRPAVELWPEDATYQGALGWALFKAPPSDPIRARQHLERGYELEPRNAEVVMHLSVVLKALGEVAAASNLAQKAREIDPSVG
ncbi:MAG: DnaJ domain-containing protein [Myxococcota bacterium]